MFSCSRPFSLILVQTAYWYQASYSISTDFQGWEWMRALKLGRDITSAWRGSRYLPAGLEVSLERSHMQESGMRVRKPEVGSAMKQRPPGRRMRKISRSTASLRGTMRKEAGDDDGVDGVGGVGKSMGVAVGEGAVFEVTAGGAGAGTFDEAAGEVDAGGVDGGVVLGETAGVEAGAAAEFEDLRTGGWAFGGEDGVGDRLGMVAEEVLAAHGVEP